MANKKGLGEIFKSIKAKRSPAAIKKALLEANQEEPMVGEVLKYAYHPGIIWELPETDPPYTALEKNNDAQNMLYSQFRTLYLFCRGGNPNLKQLRRESLYVELLESVDPDDAILLLEMKNKKIKYIKEDIAMEVFPELFPEVIA